MKNTALYRHFDADGNLLYVGISKTVMNRIYSHILGSSWSDEIKRIELEYFSTAKDALKAERVAIEKESPKFNIQFSLENKHKRKNKGEGSTVTLRLDPELDQFVKDLAKKEGRSFNKQVIRLIEDYYR